MYLMIWLSVCGTALKIAFLLLTQPSSIFTLYADYTDFCVCQRKYFFLEKLLF
jgi:hypothetical protein